MKKIVLVLVSVIFFSGCGYRTFSVRTDEHKKIQILPVKNKINITEEKQRHEKINIYPKGLENKITRMLKEKFLWQQDIKVTDVNPDLILETELIEYRRTVIAYDDSAEDSFRDEPREYRLFCKVKVMLQSSEGEVVFEEEISERDSFFLRKETLQDAEQALAEKIAQQILEEVIFRW